MCSIAHVLVCYYNEDEIYNFITGQVFKQTILPEKVFIINNGAEELGRLLELGRRYGDRIQLFSFGENLGYLGAFITLLKRGALRGYDFVILSNSDMRFDGDSFYQDLCAYPLTDDIGLIAPDILTRDHRYHLNPYIRVRPPLGKLKAKLRFLRLIYSNPVLYLIYTALYNLKRKISGGVQDLRREMDIYAPHGSFLIFSKAMISRFNFSYNALLFGEEIFLGEVCFRLGLKVRYLPALRVIHEEHSTTRFLGIERNLRYRRESLEFLINFLEGVAGEGG